MTSMEDRIRARLAELGMSPRQASLAAGMSSHWLRDLLAGKAKSPKVESLKKLANVMYVSFEWLADGGETPPTLGRVPLMGLIGAGAQIVPFDGDLPLEYVDLPPGATGIAGAARVWGDSQHPVYRSGDLVYWTVDAPDPLSCVGRDCVVTLEDGRVFLKTLERGSGDGLWTLASFNAAPIRDVRLTSVAPVAWQRRL